MKRIILILLIFTTSSGYIFAQKDISGKVTSDEDGSSLPGVNVVVVGSQQGSITDVDGNYKISVEEGASLKFSYIGYIDQVILVGNQSIIDVVMESDVTQLSEVVVTAFGIEKEKKALGYSVTELEGEDFVKAREINLGDALTGKVAGVNVANIGSGVAGSSRVIIRGNNSLTGNNQPLYVIDGVPMDNTQQGNAGMWGGQDWGDGLSSLNPDDIQTMSVLKGNTAAALYGSRASNGVILITTKKGTSRKGIGVDFNSTYTAERFINNYDFQDQYGHGNRGAKPTTQEEALDYGGSAWGAMMDGSSVIQFDGVERPYSFAGDNFANYYKTGNTFTNTLALTGGSDTQTFRFSISDLRNNAITPNSGMKRQNLTLTTNSVFAKKLTLSAKAQYSHEDVDNRARLSDAPGNGNYALVALPPSIAVEDMKGTTDKLGAKEDGTELGYSNNIYSQNPYWAAYQFETKDVRDRIIASALLRYDITDWLYIHGRVGTDWYTTRRTSIEPYGTAYKPRGGMNENQYTRNEVNAEYMIGYDDTFGDIRVTAFFGGNYMRRKYEQVGGGGNDFNVPFLHTLSNLANRSPNYDITEWGINSLFGSAEISWKNMLFLSATGRQDWFSTLPPDNNSLFYPSIGASWVFSDAFAMPEFFTFGKVRASWAQTSGGANPYSLDLNYGLVGQGHLGATLGRINNGSIPNSQLSPLISSETELGFDIGFFQNRLRLDYAYYTRKTEDEILNASISSTSGYGSATVNVGEISNSGHEVLLTGTPVKGDLRWDISLNFAQNETTVDKLYEDSKILGAEEARSRNTYSQHRIAYTDDDGVYQEGGYSVIVGYTHKMIDGQKVYDEDGLPVRSDGVSVLGNGVHPFTGGINNSFAWKNWNLSFLIDFKSGGDLYTGTNVTAYGSGLHKETLVGREDGLTISGVDEEGVAGQWVIPGTSSDPAAIIVQNYYSRMSSISEYFVHDASYAKLRQLVFGYSFPSSMLQNTPLNAVTISFVGRNLFLLYSNIDNVDPESTYTTNNGQGLEWLGVPQTRSYGFNLNIKF